MASVDDLLKGFQGLSAEDRERALAALGLQPDEEQKKDSKKGDGETPGGSGIKKEGGGEGSHGGQGSSGSLAPVPRVGFFSGEDGKTSEVSFSQWKFEVRGLQADELYSAGAIKQAVRRSLRGRAADVVLRLKSDAGIEEVVAKLEQIFGNVLPAENVLELFYVARQDGRESVASWACRVEDLMAQLREKKAVASEAEESMLRTKFYSGLSRASIRNAIRHRFDGGATYAELLKAARVAELENPARNSQVVADESQLSAVVRNVEAIAARLDGLEKKVAELGNAADSQRPRGAPFRGQCYGCGQVGHPVARCPLNGQAGLGMTDQPTPPAANRGGQTW